MFVPEQEAAHQIKMLAEVQPLIEQRLELSNGSNKDPLATAVEQHLHEDAYSTSELEEALGVPLTQLFKGNASQMRVLEIAESAGGYIHTTCQQCLIAALLGYV